MMDTARFQFEAWQIEEGLTDPMWFEPGYYDEQAEEYRLDRVQSDWRIWQTAWKASRESLEIDLPAVMEMEYYGGVMDSEDVLDAIQSIGLKLKP